MSEDKNSTDRNESEKPKPKLIQKAVLGLLAILIPLIITYFFDDIREAFNNKEAVSIQYLSSEYGEALNYSSYYSQGRVGGFGYIEGITHSVMITNNSKTAVSLNRLYLYEKIGENYNTQPESIEIFDSNNAEIKLPINLDSKNSILLKVKNGRPIGPELNKLIADKYGDAAELSIEQLKEAMDEYGYDIYGNKYGKYVGAISPKAEFPDYRLEVVTGTDVSFGTEFTHTEQ